MPRASSRVELIGGAEAETVLHTIANSLFRAASPESRPVRVVRVRVRAINAFVSTGNRRFAAAGLRAPMRSTPETSPTL
jgi:predicted Zn-dependent protease